MFIIQMIERGYRGFGGWYPRFTSGYNQRYILMQQSF